MLLVGGRSTDNSTKIAEEYARRYPDKVRFIDEGEQSIGMSAARNLGVKHSCGKYIAFLDADDIWLPGKLDRQVGIMERDRDLGLVLNNHLFWFVEEDGRKKPSEITLTPGKQPIGVWFSKLFDRDNTVPPTVILARKDLLDQIGGSEESFRGLWEDSVLYLKINLNAPIYYDPEYVALYRIHAGSDQDASYKKQMLAATHFCSWLTGYLKHQQDQFRSEISWVGFDSLSILLSHLVSIKEFEAAMLLVKSTEMQIPVSDDKWNYRRWNFHVALCLHNLQIDLEDALRRYNLALEFGYDEFWVRYNRGSLHAKLGNIEQAKADLTRAVELKPEHKGGRQALQNVLLDMTRHLASTSQFQAALELIRKEEPQILEPLQKGEWNYLAAFCLQSLKNNLQEALHRYDLALEYGFDEFWVRYNRGSLHAKLGNIEQAREDLTRAVKLKPEHEGAREVLKSLA